VSDQAIAASLMPQDFGQFGLLGDSPPSLQKLRFVFDSAAGRLRILQRQSETELWSVPLSDPTLTAYALSADLMPPGGYHVVGPVAVLTLGPLVIGLDLEARRINWTRHLLHDTGRQSTPVFVPSGGVSVTREDGATFNFGLVCASDPYGVYLILPSGLIALDPSTGAIRWRRTDVPGESSIFRDATHLFVADFYRAGGALRGIRAIRAIDGVAVPVPDGAMAAFEHRIGIHDGRLLTSDAGPNGEVHLRLYDVLAGKDLWTGLYPARSIVTQSTMAELTAVVMPTGEIAIIDLAARKELVRTRVEAAALEKLQSATVLADRQHCYLALVREQQPDDKEVATGSLFQGELTSVPVNGRLYAFDRVTGKTRWYQHLPNQTILVDRFDDLPLILCAAQVQRTPGSAMNPTPQPVQQIQQIHSIDKATGKTRFKREAPFANGGFHTLRVDPYQGVIDLLANSSRWRHEP
jgi:outer membrane protein assembly factor BamB